jgi:hypothetical protein
MALWSNLSFRLRALTHRGHFKKRYDVINYFAKRQRAKRYLEIGTRGGRTLQRVQVAHKVGVDPSPGPAGPGCTVYTKSSDEFFAMSDERFELIFIDGLHLAEQVLRDIWNSVAALAPGGAILLHDCSPPSEERASRDVGMANRGAWNGDVWKAIAYFRSHQPDVFCRVLDLDQGIGVLLPRADDRLPPLDPALEADAERYFASLAWSDLEQNRGELLGLIPDRAMLERAMAEAGV